MLLLGFEVRTTASATHIMKRVCGTVGRRAMHGMQRTKASVSISHFMGVRKFPQLPFESNTLNSLYIRKLCSFSTLVRSENAQLASRAA